MQSPSAQSQHHAQHRGTTIDFQKLPPGANFLRVLGVNYVHCRTEDGGDLYVTPFGIPFWSHLQPENWYEEQWFCARRIRLEGTSAVYRVPTRPIEHRHCRSIDLVVKWSRVGQDVPLDTFTLAKAINAEFNTPFEEFSLVEELRQAHFGPRSLRIPMQKPLAIYAPPEKMQLWQSGRSRDKLLSRVARHPGIEIDILRSYILIYAWLKGLNAVEAFSTLAWDRERQVQEQQSILQQVNADLERKGFMVADNKPTHIILRPNNGLYRRRRDGSVMYGLVDYELLTRTPEYGESVKRVQRSRYLQLQKTRFDPGDVEFPEDLAPTNVLGVDYVWGKAQSTGGSIWVVGKNPELFSYFLPEKWRFKQVNLSLRRQTYYVQTKDRIHLVWEVSRLGEIPLEGGQWDHRFEEIVRFGFNSPFEEFALALELQRRGIKVTYPRAIYMTGSELQAPTSIIDDNRYEKLAGHRAPDGEAMLRMDRDYIVIWGYWRGLEDDYATEEVGHWTPIDLTRAAAKGLISTRQLVEQIDRQRQRLAQAGFEDLTLNGNHILLSYIPEGKIKLDADGQYELRQCNFELVRPLNAT